MRAESNSPGEMGSRAVCEPFAARSRTAGNRILERARRADFPTTARLPNGDPVVAIRDLLRFAGVANRRGGGLGRGAAPAPAPGYHLGPARSPPAPP